MIKVPLLLCLLVLGKSLWAMPVTSCGLRIGINNVAFTWSGSSEVFTGTIQVTRTKSSRKCRRFLVGFSKGGAGNYARKMYGGAQFINYNFFKNNLINTPIKEIRDASNNDELVVVNFTNNSQRVINVTFEARVPVPNNGRVFLPSGTYNDTISATIRGNGNRVRAATTSFRSSIYVPPEVDISLVQSGGPFDVAATNYTLNFGEIVRGVRRQLDLRVKSNTAYRVFIASRNGGHLKHLIGSDTIPYTFRANGRTHSLSSRLPANLGTSSQVTSAQGDRFALEFAMGSPSLKRAGDYEDVLTITAMSN